MKKAKRQKLEAAGWHVGSTSDFLGLSREEAAFVEMKLALASIAKRLPGLRLADGAEVNWVPSLASRGLEELRIAHDAKP